MLVHDLVESIEAIAPRALAEPWDNTGLIIGSGKSPLSGPVLLTIDLQDGIFDEAVSAGCSAIISYHPPVFEGMKRITDQTQAGRIVLRAAQRGMAVYSPHTALDAAAGGMADWLADGLARGSTEIDRRAITPAPVYPGEHVKIVTFVPTQQSAVVREALAAAGVGCIGNYAHCSFTSTGTGTFLGGEHTQPAVGQKGRLESVAEARLEMICPRSMVPGAIAALRRAHPYEEPATDIIPLLPSPNMAQGAGRIVTLAEPLALGTVVERARAHLGAGATIQASRDRNRPIRVIGACPGAGASLIDSACRAGCELFVTGELKHHETLAALDAGLSLILAGHTQTERGFLPVLAARLSRALPGTRFMVSMVDAAPLEG